VPDDEEDRTGGEREADARRDREPQNEARRSVATRVSPRGPAARAHG
jgi:hypothetical protein